MNTDVLLGLFTHLKARGLPLGTRDFIEGIQAFYLYRDQFLALQQTLQTSVTYSEESAYRSTPALLARPALIWLCQTLWARSPQERQLIRQVIENDISLPDNRLTLEWQERHPSLALSLDQHDCSEPIPVIPIIQPSAPEDAMSEEKANQNAGHTAPQSRQHEHNTVGVDVVNSLSMNTPTVSDHLHIPLPAIDDSRAVFRQPYTLVNESLLNELWLLSLWRRLYKPIKHKDRRLVDISRTVEQISKTGVLLTPEMCDHTTNTAELLLLLDISDAMAPWKTTTEMIIRTAHSKLSRLKRVGTYYFNEMPGTRLFSDTALTQPHDTTHLLQTTRQAYIIVIGEAGAASGLSIPALQQRLKTFIDTLTNVNNPRVAWINPMPRPRWHTPLMDSVLKCPFIHAGELSPRSLLHIIEYLRAL